MLLPARTAGFIDSITREEQQRATERRPIVGGKFESSGVEERERTPTIREGSCMGWEESERKPELSRMGWEGSERKPELLSASSWRNQRCDLAR